MRKVTIVLAVALLALTACSGSDPVVAAYEDSSIHLSDVEAMAGSEGAAPAEDVASDLTDMLWTGILVDAAEQDFGVVLDDQAIEEARRAVAAGAPEGTTLEDAVAEGLITQAQLDRAIMLSALQDPVAERLVADDPQVAYQAYFSQNGSVCAAQIVTATEDEARVALRRVEEGEAFADVAREMSTDPGAQAAEGEPGAGGDMGCFPPAQYPQFGSTLIDAPIGELVGPVQTQFGFHVFLVESRDGPTLEEVQDQLAALAPSVAAQLFSEWATTTLQEADVRLDPDFGTWAPNPQVGNIPTVSPPL